MTKTPDSAIPDGATPQAPTLAPRMRRHWWGAAVGIAVLVAGIAVTGVAVADSAETRAPATSASAPASASSPTPGYGSAGANQDPAETEPQATRTQADATRVEIPSIGVDSTLEHLAIDPTTGELAPPVEWLSAGWYSDGTVPGDIGPAVIAGHVDSVTAPAVFARLGELTPGAVIRVTLSDGQIHEFEVDSSTEAPKNAFPTDLVYGPTPTAQLRLITCDGTFDSSTGHYLDNLVVFATLVS